MDYRLEEFIRDEIRRYSAGKDGKKERYIGGRLALESVLRRQEGLKSEDESAERNRGWRTL